MSRFLKYIFVFAAVFFLFDKLFYVFLFVSPTLEVDKRLEKMLNGDIDEDVIIFGSSRGARDIIAHQIEDSLSLAAYNLSYPGSDIEFHLFLLQTFLHFNKNPEIVVLTIDDQGELLPGTALNFRLDRLYPLAKYKYINDEMIKRKENTFLSRFLVLARLNQRNFDIRKKHFSVLDTITSCGSMPISYQMKEKDFSYYNSPQIYDPTQELAVKIKAFAKFQEICIANNIKLYLIFPPNFKDYNALFEKRIRQITLPGISIFVYDSLISSYHDKSFYYDNVHLQTKGAVIFTNEIIGELKKAGKSVM